MQLRLLSLVACAAAFAPRSPVRSATPRFAGPASSQSMLPASAQKLMGMLGTAEKRADISFDLTMEVIADMYDYRDVAFSVGDVVSAAGDNKGSSKIFAFAKIAGLEASTTLALFGAYFYDDVLKHPDGSDHANIRAFMAGGWDCVAFPDGLSLAPKDLQNSYEAFGPALGSEYQTS